jgi:hypothetical protein
MQSVSSSNIGSIHYSIGTHHSKSIQNLLIFNVIGETIDYQQGGKNITLSSINKPIYLTNLTSDTSNVGKRSFSIGLEQRGADSTQSKAHIWASSMTGSKSGDPQSSFWLGLGSDCILPCFQNVDCSALYGSSYTVTSFPSVRVGTCTYGHSALDITSSTNTNSIFSYAKGSTVDIKVWGKYPTAYPISFASFHFQPISYDSANAGPSSIASMVSAHTKALIANNMTVFELYGNVGDWRDTWPALPGKSTLRLKLHLPPSSPSDVTSTSGRQAYITTDSALGIVHSNFLKYEDHGMLGYFHIISSNITNYVKSNNNNYTFPAEYTSASEEALIDQTDYSTMTQAEVLAMKNSTSNNAGNAVDRENVTATLVAPKLDPRTLDSLENQWRCDSAGGSWAYTEEIDFVTMTRTLRFNGCPNHFSVCQSSECAGLNATRAILHPDVMVVPLFPSFSTRFRDATCTQDKIGIALNGVGITSSPRLISGMFAAVVKNSTLGS